MEEEVKMKDAASGLLLVWNEEGIEGHVYSCQKNHVYVCVYVIED